MPKRRHMPLTLNNWTVGCCLVWCLACQSVPSLTSGFVETKDKTRIAYIRGGQADTTLFFIHGWCINKEYWQNQLNHFASTYTVVAIDVPGFGNSSKDRTQWDFNQYALDIKTCIDQLKLKNVILIGHSMSGDLILKADEAFPELIAGIIGIDNLHSPAGPSDSATQARTNAYFDDMDARFDSVVVNTFKPYLFIPSTPDSIVSRVTRDIFSSNHILAVEVLRSLDRISQTEKVMMKKLSHTLHLVNSDTYPVQLDSLHAYCAKGVKIYTVRASGHYPMIEKPQEFNRALQQAIWNQ